MRGRPLALRCLAEGMGTLLLLTTVVGSGIMGERLAGGNVAIALLANSLATGLGLGVFILCLAPVSGAHFNPVVTLALTVRDRSAWPAAGPVIAAQLLGAFAGVLVAHAMFGLTLLQASGQARHGTGLLLSEIVATFGLLFVVLRCSEQPSVQITAVAVGCYVTAAYWFTASTAFANPAVTLARTVTATFTGIRAGDAPAFIAAQLAGAGLALALHSTFGGTPVSSGGRSGTRNE